MNIECVTVFQIERFDWCHSHSSSTTVFVSSFLRPFFFFEGHGVGRCKKLRLSHEPSMKDLNCESTIYIDRCCKNWNAVPRTAPDVKNIRNWTQKFITILISHILLFVNWSRRDTTLICSNSHEPQGSWDSSTFSFAAFTSWSPPSTTCEATCDWSSNSPSRLILYSALADIPLSAWSSQSVCSLGDSKIYTVGCWDSVEKGTFEVR